MKKYFGITLSLICLLGTSVFATYDDFSSQLENMGLNVQTISSQKSVSRYDLARLLNIVECKDCIQASQDMIATYTQSFWSKFTDIPGKDFEDVTFLGGISGDTSYYYCVAYVGDNSYMRGYPKATSPICGGQFCGVKNTTTAEFIQVVINILAKYVYKDIQLNRKEVNTRLSKLKTESYEAKNINANDKKIITEESKACDNKCALQTSEEVSVYLKYCMFNLEKCSMQEVGKIKQGYRPVAEINLLYKQNIINIDQSQRKVTDKDIDGKTVIETLFKLNSKIDCAFDNDYDCDETTNSKDNCPNTYNPQQKDTDTDNRGDVCDDDIDGDGVKNPIGIVDEEGKVDISKRGKKMDNCLFVVNTGQEDSTQSGIGDACKYIGGQEGLYISLDKLEGSAPVTSTFKAVSAGNIKGITRDFGDGTQGNGASIKHTFTTPGMYTIKATAKGDGDDIKAQMIVIIGGQVGDENALQAKATVIGGKENTESTLSIGSIGSFDEIKRSFPKENVLITKTANQNIKKIFKQAGENPVLVKGYSKGKLASISYFTIGIAEGRGALLKSNTIHPEINEKILLDTKTYNIKQSDVITVDRDFGDGIKKTNTTLTTEYTYTQAGKKVITETITLSDGKKLTTIITLQVGDKTLLTSYALQMVPSKLIANVGEKIRFSMSIIGNLLKTPLIQIAELGDGATQQREGTEKMPNLLIHSYQKNGIIVPQESIFINQCTYLKTQVSIAIIGTDSCLNAKIQGKLKSTYTCDLDKDGIPDICDTDIDEDGKPNLLGLIDFENKDCKYEPDSNKGNANINQKILQQQYQNICSLDNAPFNPNPDQLDLNQDGIGDVQDTVPILGSGEVIDSDNDGISDTQDLCPNIQETWNGISDTDGCPEVGQELGCNQKNIGSLLGIVNDTFIINPIENNDTIPLLPSKPFPGCGNGKADLGETCNNCPQDIKLCIGISVVLPFCGNGKIDSGETCSACAKDVGICTSFCGDGTATEGETCNNCPTDVPVCGTCGDGIKAPNESCATCPQDYGACTSAPLCGNGIIDAGETCNTCPKDIQLCSVAETPSLCGNGTIDTGEDCKTCPKDVGTCTSFCGDSIPAEGETCNNCPADVPVCGTCGDSIKAPNESCATCPQDYGACTSAPLCGNGIIDAGETCNNCPKDVKLCIDIPDIAPSNANNVTCNQCPCAFADIASDFTNDDQVRAILRNKKKTIPYKFSLPWIVNL